MSIKKTTVLKKKAATAKKPVVRKTTSLKKQEISPVIPTSSTTNDFVSKHWMGLLAIIVIIIFFLFTNPFGCNPTPKPTRDTTTNTVYVPQPPIYIDRYVPVVTNSERPVYIPPQYQPSQNQDSLIKQYQNLVSKFLTVNTYKDSTILKDSSGNRVGVFNSNDVVTENEIKTRQPSYQLSFPHTTTTITIHEPYIPKFKVLIGGGVTGNQTSFVNGGYVGIGFQNKKDNIYLANAGLQNFNGLKPQFGVSAYLPIRLGKK